LIAKSVNSADSCNFKIISLICFYIQVHFSRLLSGKQRPSECDLMHTKSNVSRCKRLIAKRYKFNSVNFYSRRPNSWLCMLTVNIDIRIRRGRGLTYIHFTLRKA